MKAELAKLKDKETIVAPPLSTDALMQLFASPLEMTILDELWGTVPAQPKKKGNKHCDRSSAPDDIPKVEAKRLYKMRRTLKRVAREKEEQERQQIEATQVGASASGVAPTQIYETTTIGVLAGTPTLSMGDDPLGEPISLSTSPPLVPLQTHRLTPRAP